MPFETPAVPRDHSNIVPTMEVPEGNVVAQRILAVALIGHILVAIGLLITGGVAVRYCDELRFAGMTPFTGGLFLLQGCAAAAANHERIRLEKLAMVMSITNFLFAALIFIFEVISLRCTQAGQLVQPSLCSRYRKSLNFCDVLKSIGSVETIPSDSYFSGRVTLVILSVMALFATVTTLVLLSFTLNVGKPVYLGIKRHKKSIVVGNARNVNLIEANRQKNSVLVEPTAMESETYRIQWREKYKEFLIWKRQYKTAAKSKGIPKLAAQIPFSIVPPVKQVLPKSQIQYGDVKASASLSYQQDKSQISKPTETFPGKNKTLNVYCNLCGVILSQSVIFGCYIFDVFRNVRDSS